MKGSKLFLHCVIIFIYVPSIFVAFASVFAPSCLIYHLLKWLKKGPETKNGFKEGCLRAVLEGAASTGSAAELRY